MRISKIFDGQPLLRRARVKAESYLSTPLGGVLARRMQHRNETSIRPIVGDSPVLVSLTTYGHRFESVHLTIESIAYGKTLPQRIILWIDDDRLFNHPTEDLERLLARGLEMRKCPDYGPHKKYYPALDILHAESRSLRLVTADDDVFYPRSWLTQLVEAGESQPDYVHCFRAWSVPLKRYRTIAPYSTWLPCWTARPRFSTFPTGVSGVSFPTGVIDYLIERGTEFLRFAPRADDVWLHAAALATDTRARQLRDFPQIFPAVPNTQTTALYLQNVAGGGNDAQIADTYTADLISRIRGEDGHREVA